MLVWYCCKSPNTQRLLHFLIMVMLITDTYACYLYNCTKPLNIKEGRGEMADQCKTIQTQNAITKFFIRAQENWTKQFMQNLTDKNRKPLTLKAPRKTASENVVCLCRLLNILADFLNNIFAYRQTVWTLIRLLLIWVHAICRSDF